jgi:hypothetical protein
MNDVRMNVMDRGMCGKETGPKQIREKQAI